MIDPKRLLEDLRRLGKRLEDDLRERTTGVREMADYRAAKDAGRTGEAFEARREGILIQAGVAWILGCVFVRFLEDETGDLVQDFTDAERNPRFVGAGYVGMLTAWVLLLLVLSFPCISLAGELPLTPPPSEDGRLKIKAGMMLLDIRNIDDVKQDFEAVLIVRLSWKDPRLQTDSRAPRTFNTTEIWNPRYQITNEVFARKRFREVLHVGPDGTVVHLQRLSGRFSSRLDLRRFPLDTQALHLRLTFPDFEPEQLEALPDHDFSGMLQEMTIADWSLGEWSLTARPVRILENISRASVVFSFEAQRMAGYYVWKIIFPLVLIVFMSWTVFWINPENAGAQIGLATSSMLTLIAYRFILGNLLPRVSYLTELDYFTLGATILVFLALVEVVLTSGLAQAGKHETARRIDVGARLMFPGLLALLALAVFGI